MEPPEAVWQSFLNAGWNPGRMVPVPETVPHVHPAREVLAAFGGIVILDRNPAPDTDWPPTEKLAFRLLPTDVSVTEVWGGLLGSRLVGIADVHDAHAELYIAGDGRCFLSSCIHPAFCFVGKSFAEAAEGILLGRRARPMLRPDQESVTLYGERFTADSTQLYHYR